MLSGILPKGFGRGRASLPKATVIETIKPSQPIQSQLNINHVSGLHSGVYGDFINLSGDVRGLLGEVTPELYGNATGVVGRVDHLKGDIAILAEQLVKPSGRY